MACLFKRHDNRVFVIHTNDNIYFPQPGVSYTRYNQYYFFADLEVRTSSNEHIYP